MNLLENIKYNENLIKKIIDLKPKINSITGYCPSEEIYKIAFIDSTKVLKRKDIITDKLKDMFSSVFNLHRPSSFITIGKRVLLSTAPGGIVIISDPINYATNIQETTSDIYTNPPYPNPFSKSTTISVDWLFTLSVQSLTLKVYNSIGEEVRDVTKDLHAHAQNYRSSLVFDAGNLPDGVYYVVCKGGPHISSQRLIIAR